MIPVSAQPEPASFDAKVRRPGARWIERHQLSRRKRLPAGLELPPFWRACLDELHRGHGGICAYLCIYIERVTGAASTDHFIAKSGALRQAYEWSNYRLACTTMNNRKRDFDTVIDPFTLRPGRFHLELMLGRIYPAPGISRPERKAVQETIVQLGLDDADCRELRARRFDDYLKLRGAQRNPAAEDHLRRYAPFIHAEAKRQRLL